MQLGKSRPVFLKSVNPAVEKFNNGSIILWERVLPSDLNDLSHKYAIFPQLGVCICMCTCRCTCMHAHTHIYCILPHEAQNGLIAAIQSRFILGNRLGGMVLFFQFKTPSPALYPPPPIGTLSSLGPICPLKNTVKGNHYEFLATLSSLNLSHQFTNT